jgi:L-methionine (R)-S-oxide reductase
MADDLQLTAISKKERYEELLPQIKALVTGETDLVANLGNICAALKTGFSFFWVGFYLVKNNELVLSAFQGPVACTRIQKGKGVCGNAWEQLQTIIVPDVEQFPEHIACSSLSKSEIVIPIFNSHNECIGVLDVDSEAYNTFDEADELFLKQVVQLPNWE